jgi:hypothetical protein
MMVRSSPVRNITVTIDGVTHSGKYYTHGPMLYVHHENGRKATQIGDSAADTLARLLLSELVRDGLSTLG